MDEQPICPSDGKPCTLQCYRGHPARPCDPPKPVAARVANAAAFFIGMPLLFWAVMVVTP